MQNLNILTQLGYSPLAEQIYQSLLLHGASTISQIAERTCTHRPMIYKTLPELTRDQLISGSQRGKRLYYTAATPVKILNTLQKRMDLATQAIPTLLALQGGQPNNTQTTFVQGKREIARLYEYILSAIPKHGFLYRYESIDDYGRNRDYYPPMYWDRASSRGDIDKYVITNEKTFLGRRRRLNRSTKPIPKNEDIFEDNLNLVISEQHVLIIDTQEDSAILIENARIAHLHKKLFMMLFVRL